MLHTFLRNASLFFFFFSISAVVSVEHQEPYHVVLENCRSLQTFQKANGLQHLQPRLSQKQYMSCARNFAHFFFFLFSCWWGTADFSSNDFHMK